MSTPENNLQGRSINKAAVWQHIQHVKQDFWKILNKEYLHRLQTRRKSHTGDGNDIKIGSLVMIKENKLPQMMGILDRIVELHPGEDGVTRPVNVRTNSGLFKRSVKNICPLPFGEHEF